MRGHNIIKTYDNGNIIRDLDIANCVSGIQVVKNNVEARCQVIRGELLYNVLLGIPLHSEKDDIDLTIMNIIQTTAGVQEIRDFKSQVRDRKYMVTANILAEDTIIEVEV